MAHNKITTCFRFLKLPVAWEVLRGDRLAQVRTLELRRAASKYGWKLSLDQEREMLGWNAPAGPRLYGRLKEAASPEGLKLLELDGWYWRDSFLGLRQNDLNQLTEFLNEVGAWPSSGDPSPYTPGHHMRFPLFVEPDDLWSFRENLNHALLDRKWFFENVTPELPTPKTWLDLVLHASEANQFTMVFELTKVAAGVVTITNARHMLFATVLADAARGIRFKTCRRKDCGKPFAVETKHQRKFCGQYCAHLVSQRKKRLAEQEQRRAERKNARNNSLK